MKALVRSSTGQGYSLKRPRPFSILELRWGRLKFGTLEENAQNVNSANLGGWGLRSESSG